MTRTPPARVHFSPRSGLGRDGWFAGILRRAVKRLVQAVSAIFSRRQPRTSLLGDKSPIRLSVGERVAAAGRGFVRVARPGGVPPLSRRQRLGSNPLSTTAAWFSRWWTGQSGFSHLFVYALKIGSGVVQCAAAELPWEGAVFVTRARTRVGSRRRNLIRLCVIGALSALGAAGIPVLLGWA
jgi:hypothetical protein